MAKVYYINGFLANHARKICQFYFGDFFSKLELNEKNRSFDIELLKSIETENGIINLHDKIDVAYFKEYWGAQWRFYSTDNNKGQWL